MTEATFNTDYETVNTFTTGSEGVRGTCFSAGDNCNIGTDGEVHEIFILP